MARTTRASSPALLMAGALCLLVWSSSSAVAQDRRGRRQQKPVVQEVLMNGQPAERGPLGAVLQLRGHNFPLPPADEKEREDWEHGVEVKIGSTKCIVLDVTDQLITIIVPQFGINPGRKKIKVTVPRRGTADITFTLMDPEKWEDTQDKAVQEAAENPGGPDGAEQFRQQVLEQFRITEFKCVRDGGANRFEVAGVAGMIPAGFSLQVVLNYELNGRVREIEKSRVRVASEGGQVTFRAVFGPYTKELLYGNYAVNILFELGKQGRAKQNRFIRRLSPGERQAYSRIERRDYTTVGDEDKLREQEQVKQDHYLKLSEELVKLQDEFESAYAGACRIFFRQQGRSGYDEEKYTQYIQEMQLVEGEEELRKAKADTRFATNSGHFKPKEYAQWVESNFLPRLLGAYREHRTFVSRYIAPLDDRADMTVDFMTSIVKGFFQEWSSATYQRAELEVPQNIRDISIDPIQAPTQSQRFFRAQRRLLLRQVGLGNLVEGDEG